MAGGSRYHGAATMGASSSTIGVRPCNTFSPIAREGKGVGGASRLSPRAFYKGGEWLLSKVDFAGWTGESQG